MSGVIWQVTGQCIMEGMTGPRTYREKHPIAHGSPGGTWFSAGSFVACTMAMARR